MLSHFIQSIPVLSDASSHAREEVIIMINLTLVIIAIGNEVIGGILLPYCHYISFRFQDRPELYYYM